MHFHTFMQLPFEPMSLLASTRNGFCSLQTRCARKSSLCQAGETLFWQKWWQQLFPAECLQGILDYTGFCHALSSRLSLGYLIYPHMKDCSYPKSSLLLSLCILYSRFAMQVDDSRPEMKVYMWACVGAGKEGDAKMGSIWIETTGRPDQSVWWPQGLVEVVG